MMQLKAIFSDLLREFEFELAQPAETYRNDHSKMVVQTTNPGLARERRPEKTASKKAGFQPGPAAARNAGANARARRNGTIRWMSSIA